MTNESFVSSLRQIADFFEANPNLETPALTEVYSISRENFAGWVQAFGYCEKKISGNLFKLSRKFGEIDVEVVALRSCVCKAKVVGKRTIPETIIPAMPETVIPAREEDIIEWDCKEPILAEKDVQEINQ